MAKSAGFRTVNDVLDQAIELNGQPVEVEGILTVQPEGYHLLHFPKSERRDDRTDDGPIYRSSLWLATGSGSLQQNHSVLGRWCGKRVRVHGIVHSSLSQPSQTFHGHGGYGPFGFWPAQVMPYSVQRVTSGQRRESGT